MIDDERTLRLITSVFLASVYGLLLLLSFAGLWRLCAATGWLPSFCSRRGGADAGWTRQKKVHIYVCLAALSA